MSSNGEWYNLVKIQDSYRESRMWGASVSDTLKNVIKYAIDKARNNVSISIANIPQMVLAKG